MFFVLPIQNEKPDINRLIADHSQNLTRFCYLYLKDFHLAEDAVQDTFIKAFTKYNTFKNQCSEKTWITKIAINVCKNYMRKKSFKESAADNVVSLYIVSENELDIEYRNEDSILLLNTVFSLPEIYKQVILLYYYQDLSILEISNVLGQKQGTISVRLKRAKELLKSILEED